MNIFYTQVNVNGLVRDYLVQARTAERAEALVLRRERFGEIVTLLTFEKALAMDRPPQLLLNFLYEDTDAD